MANAVMYYNWIGKNVLNNWSVYYEVYGNMFWQTLPNTWAVSYTVFRMSWESSYDLQWFQPWHLVLWYVPILASNWDSWSYNISAYLQYNDSWTWRSTWDVATWSWTTSTNQVRKWLWVIWIKSNNIRPTFWNQYRIYTTWSVWSYTWTDKILNFTVSNLSVDTNVYQPWNMMVDWANIVYADVYWAKHIIAYDGNYNWSYAWSSKAWFMWLDPDVIRRLYYVDEYWYVRRTYEASNRVNYTSWQWRSVWSSYRWSIWTWKADSTWAVRYLCFVNNNWYAMRLMNWNPNWTE